MLTMTVMRDDTDYDDDEDVYDDDADASDCGDEYDGGRVGCGGVW